MNPDLEISAPWPAVTNILFLPSPEMGNTFAGLSNVTHQQSMDGSYWTHKVTRLRTFNWSFVLTRKKALEFLEFFRFFSASKCQVILPEGDVIVGYFRFNPLSLDSLGRGIIASSYEKQGLQVQFEEA